MNLSAACICITGCDNIASASYNWAPTELQQVSWRLRMLHSNELHCAVRESSFTWSVFAIWPCIPLHKYACNVLQIWFFTCSCILIFKNPQTALLYRYFRQAFELDYPLFQFLPPCRIQNLWTPYCSRWWSLPGINVSLFMLWATVHHKSSLMRGGLQWM